ncbi:MAG: Fic family protein [Bacilli bacterium]|nr:Fic family protein [Bacilli bacterium]
MKDLYLYPNSNVLVNKLNIKSSKELDEAENAFVSLNIANLLSNPFEVKTVFDVKKIHKRLFSDLYGWAGENRKINMFKEEPVLNGLSVEYSDYHKIDRDLERLDRDYQDVEWNSLTKKETIEAIVKLISRLWRIHCFREGNTRTTTTFLYLFMKQKSLKVNVEFIGRHAKYFRSALVLASIDQYSEYEHLTNILMDSISLKVPEEGKYKTIREYEVEKYEYIGHKYKD